MSHRALRLRPTHPYPVAATQRSVHPLRGESLAYAVIGIVFVLIMVGAIAQTAG